MGVSHVLEYFRSVHNIRIERLWLDVTSGFGAKWKTFFEILEAHDGLNTDSNAHIWLLQRLFLDKINADAESWCLTWNQHTLARRGQAHQSPQQLYTHGMITNGIRGIYPENEDEIEDGDYDGYGIDWEDMDRPAILQHHQAYNLANDEVDDQNPFVVNHPDRLSHIEVPDLRCPFNAHQLAEFELALQDIPTFSAIDMHSNRLTWIDALNMATNIMQR